MPVAAHWPLPPLHWAIHNGAAKEARQLLKVGADIRALDEAGNTALGYVFSPPFIPGARTMFYEAAPGNQTRLSATAQLQTVKALLAAGADANAVHWHSAAIDFRPRGALSQGSLNGARARMGRHPPVPILHAAACCNDPALLAALLRAGANPNAALEDGRTALDLAHLHGSSFAVVAMLTKAGTRRTRPDTLAQLARRGDLPGVVAMLRQGMQPDTPEPDLTAQRAFYPAAVLTTQSIHGHHFPAPRTMLEFPVFPLMQAVAGGHEAVALALLDEGADPRSCTMREAGLLGWAARQGMARLCARLIDAGWDPNGSSADLQSPLTRAAGQHAETVRVLLRKGANPDGNPANVNDFPLAQAVLAANAETVGVLLAAGAGHRSRDHRRTAALKSLKHANAAAETKARVAALFTGGAVDKHPDPLPLEPAFQAVLDWMQQEHGGPLAAWARGAGVFAVRDRDHARLRALRRGVLERGFFAAFGEIARNGTAVPLLIFPSPDPYAALQACETKGGRHGHDTAAIVAWLRDLNRLHPYELEGCGSEFVLGRFCAPVGPAALFLARRMLDFCPDLRGRQADPARALAADLQRRGSFHFCWR